MKKQTIVAAMLGLAMAGCAHTRKAGPPDGPADQPVGMAPIPSLHDTINRGFANPAVARTTLPDPANPNWSARPYPPGSPARGAAPSVATTGKTVGAGAAAAAVAAQAQPPAELPALAPEVGLHEASTMPRIASGDPAVSPSSIPQPPAASAPGEVIDVSPLPPVADTLDTPELATPPATEAHSEPAASPANAPSPVPIPGSSPAAPGQPSAAAADPLLGPTPELMPSALDGLVSPEVRDPGPDNPAGAPATPAAPAAPTETSSLPDLSPSPAAGGGAGPAPSPTPAPAEPTTGPTSSTSPTASDSQTLAAQSPAPRVDPHVLQTSAPAAADRVDDVIDPKWKRAGETAARVGDEVITMLELVNSVKDQIRKHGVSIREIPRAEMNMLAQNILANLIERSLIYQEAKHQLKDKNMSHLLEIADKEWTEQELPPLLRQNLVENEHQLKLKLEESRRSLAALKLSYRQDFIAMCFIQQKLKDKVNVELPEMLKYYNAHINDQTNYRPARITWREVVVETAKHPSPADARRKADALIARLQSGEDFAKLARAESDGPSGVKAEGGLMETSPGSYAVATVNQAIESLPLNTISGVIEGPSSFHIVRVEQRRAAGPAGFAELQDQIRREIYTEKTNRERRLLLAKLRSNTVVTSMFDGTESDPNAIKR
ncbi:MAG: peptidylprolyl isomerase [Paludisphaera borealis]|uniref:peptidylprolyl isomerase n=1 Tax=Paludisphaera borealis TaxID=1387353 RepID=UPI00284CF185|nr:peptidylprolyl isomerase [Paludisphaera borealis]MDR3620853.1 peptidylprolyl isomerase [Paludisphaera borealis]